MLPIFLTLKDLEEQRLAEQLYLSYKNRMYNIAYAILHSREDAEDAVMDAVYNIVKSISIFVTADQNKTRSLIVMITRNAAINRYRRNRHRTYAPLDEMGEAIPDDAPTAPELVIAEEQYERLLSRIGGLPPLYRDVLLLKYLYETPNDLAASLLGISEATVRVRLMRARKMLKQLLEGGLNDEK